MHPKKDNGVDERAPLAPLSSVLPPLSSVLFYHQKWLSMCALVMDLCCTPAQQGVYLASRSFYPICTRGGDAIPINQACAGVSTWLHKLALENFCS